MSAIGYDLGNHSSYVALVRTGGIDTVDNEFSYRATPTVVSFSPDLRLAGNAAKSRAVTDHRNTIANFKNLIGLDYDSPLAQFEMSLIPSKFVKLQDGKIGVEVDYLGNHCQFSILQLMAAILSDLHKTTLKHIPKITASVFSVPNWFTHVQREYFLTACKIANFSPSALISDSTAVALNYILFKSDLPKDSEPPKLVCFVDVGYSSCQITIAAFNYSKVKILSSVGTNIIGGRMFDQILFNKFSAEFQSKHGLNVRDNIKAYRKLLNECEVLKKQLNSTSTELPLKIECFMNDIDFFSKTSRDEFDALSANLYETFEKFLKQSLEVGNIHPEHVHSIEAVGGSSRLLGLRKVIANIFNKEVSTTLNADEAVSRGCAIKCALISPIVRIREIELKDQISLDFSASYLTKNNEQKVIGIYGRNSAIPAKKELVFPAFGNFSFSIHQTDITGKAKEICTCSVDAPDIAAKAEKLTFYCNVESACVFSVVKAFYTLNKDGNQDSSNLNNDPEDSSDNSNQNNDKKAKKVKETQDVKFNVVFNENPITYLESAKKIEIDILAQIENEKLRSQAKNNLEEFIYSSRDQAESIFKEYITNEELESYLKCLSNEEEWLYDEGSCETLEIYQGRLIDLQSKFSPFIARRDAFEKGRTSVDILFKALMHYRKFLETLAQNQEKYTHVPAQDINEYSQKISQTESFAFQVDSALKNTPKTKLPPVSFVDVEQKISELRFYCDKFLKMAETPPPPKPQEQPQVNGTADPEATEGA